MSAESNDIEVVVSENIATITFRRPTKLNAIRVEDYDALAESLRLIDKRDDVLVTVLQATGKFFCAGTDVSVPRKHDPRTLTERRAFVDGVTRSNTDCSRALYSHRKILVAALNGPVMGIASAFLGHFDFIYCLPETWLSVPFTFIGIVAEAGSSVSFVNRMGPAKANEVLLFGKKLDAQELLACGFVNKIFPSQSVESFHGSVRKLLLEQLDGLDPSALLKVKELIQYGVNEKNSKDATNLRESYAQAECYATGTPAKRFTLIAEKKIRHKL